MSSISFSDSVDELDDELDESEDKGGDLFLFPGIYPNSFFSFCWSVLLTLGLMKGNFFFLSLTCAFYLAYLFRKLWVTLFTGLSYELSPALSISWPASSLELTTREITFALLDLTTVEIALASCWSVCRDSASLKLYDIIYSIKYIFLDNISNSLPVVRARRLPFANKVEKGLRIGLHDG